MNTTESTGSVCARKVLRHPVTFFQALSLAMRVIMAELVHMVQIYLNDDYMDQHRPQCLEEDGYGNALAYEASFKMKEGSDRSVAISKEKVDQARKILSIGGRRIWISWGTSRRRKEFAGSLADGEM